MRSYCYRALVLKDKEKKYKRNINNDLAIVASQIPEGVIHDRRGRSLCKKDERSTGRGTGSIEEKSGRSQEVCRQKEK